MRLIPREAVWHRSGVRGVSLACVLAVSVAVFAPLFKSGSLLYAIDFSFGSALFKGSRLPEAFAGSWHSTGLIGNSGTTSLTALNLLLWILPDPLFGNWIYAFCLIVSSILLFSFLHLRGCSPPSCVISLVGFWTGTNLTLIYPGHMQKFGAVALAVAVLYCVEKAVLTRRWSWGVLAGGALGGMFLEQQDVALFMGLFLGAYAVYAVIREEKAPPASAKAAAGKQMDTDPPSPRLRRTSGRGWKRIGKGFVGLLPVVAVALLLVGPIIGKTYRTKVTETASVGEGAGEQQKWEFCTQWSLPVEESLDLIAPSFFGIRSGEPAGPYWGRTGQSAGWEQTKRGLRNLRTEGIYVGVIPVVLAILGLMLALVGGFSDRINRIDGIGQGDGERRGDAIFWGSVAVITLLLSYGKFAPFYRWFWQLPMIHPIRNPNKHLHMFQIAVGILAALGIDGLLRGGWAETKRGRIAAWSGVGLFGLAAVGLLVGAGVVKGASAALTQGFAEDGWGQAASVIVENMVRALVHGGRMAVLGGVCVAGAVLGRGGAFSRKDAKTQRGRGWIEKWVGIASVCVMLLAVAADCVWYSRDYVKTVDRDSVVGENAVTAFLEENLGSQRVFFFSQSGFYNQWITMLFRGQMISLFNVPSMERLNWRLKELLDTVGKNPLRLWELAGIRYALGPVQVWPQIQGQPEWKSAFEPAMGFNVFPRNGGVGVESVRAGQTPQHLVLRYKRGLDRYTLVPSWRDVPDEAACSELAKESFNPRAEALISPEFVDKLPPEGVAKASGRVEILGETVSSMRLRTQAQSDQLMVISQRFDPDFKATVDGKPAPVVRCNFLCVGVPVPAGDHEVVIRYRPSLTGFYIQAFGALVVLGAAAYMAVRRLSAK